jgi:hypothetical protein
LSPSPPVASSKRPPNNSRSYLIAAGSRCVPIVDCLTEKFLAFLRAPRHWRGRVEKVIKVVGTTELAAVRLPEPLERVAESGRKKVQHLNSSEFEPEAPSDAYESVSLTRAKHMQLGNAIVGAAEPTTKLAVNILHHHHIRVDVSLVVRVKFSGRELVEHGWAFRDDGG